MCLCRCELGLELALRYLENAKSIIEKEEREKEALHKQYSEALLPAGHSEHALSVKCDELIGHRLRVCMRICVCLCVCVCVLSLIHI